MTVAVYSEVAGIKGWGLLGGKASEGLHLGFWITNHLEGDGATAPYNPPPLSAPLVAIGNMHVH